MSGTSIISRVMRRLSGFGFRYAAARSVTLEGSVKIEGCWPRIINLGTMRFGAGIMFRAPRLPQALTVLPGGTLEIGADSFFNEGVNICAAHSIKIGRHAKIGDIVYIYDTDFHQVKPNDAPKVAPVVIGENVWICAGVMVLPGTTIGDHSVIGAGSLVVGDIPSRSIAVGRPARVIDTFNVPDNWVRR